VFIPTAKILIPILNGFYSSGRETLENLQWSENLKAGDVEIEE
jgi:hypothetical protein